MRLEAVKISKIKGAVYQPRQQKEKDIEELAKSIINLRGRSICSRVVSDSRCSS